ncbi:MAG TPA: translation elongation factor Ts [Proteobacteria bacterium]|nr:elongation factor Ts [bacterium BMS3Abin14]HDL53888.1 translation elongation factor Ts [Pseudomonadota bacterium]
MGISASMVKELREKTGAGFMDCKTALVESDGDAEKAVDFLRKKGLSAAGKRAGRQASEGVVGSYIHMGGKIGVIIEVNCETDFVARTDDFMELVSDLAMHVAASNPLYLRADEVPEDLLNREREIYRAQAVESGKPEKIVDKIVDGKVQKYLQEICLEDQEFIREKGTSVLDFVKSVAGKLGENVQIRRFARFEIGEGQEKAAVC